MIAPLIPGLNDEEMPEILAAAAAAGAQWASYIMVRLPGAVEPLFMEWLTRHYPDRASKVEARLRSVRGGSLSEHRFHTRMRGEGQFATLLQDLFEVSLRRHGLAHRSEHELSTAHFRPTAASQLQLAL
jgi:DNA repair photolyase